MKDNVEARPLRSGSLLRRLREEILAQPTGSNLGTETEIVERMKVGRATLRQAARILEQEQLITVQRGARGGYVTRRPDVHGIARAATLYLSLRQATIKHLGVASRVLNIEVYRIAAMSQDAARRETLRRTIDELKATYDPDMTVSEYLRRGERIRNCILELADNPFLELFLRIVYIFGARMQTASVFTDHPERMQVMEARQWRVGEAILNGEPEVTAALNAEGWRLIESWTTPVDGDQAAGAADKSPAAAAAGLRES